MNCNGKTSTASRVHSRNANSLNQFAESNSPHNTPLPIFPAVYACVDCPRRLELWQGGAVLPPSGISWSECRVTDASRTSHGHWFFRAEQVWHQWHRATTAELVHRAPVFPGVPVERGRCGCERFPAGYRGCRRFLHKTGRQFRAGPEVVEILRAVAAVLAERAAPLHSVRGNLPAPSVGVD